jgi:hypothetical protein
VYFLSGSIEHQRKKNLLENSNSIETHTQTCATMLANGRDDDDGWVAGAFWQVLRVCELVKQ